jgi:hypothetical protein
VSTIPSGPNKPLVQQRLERLARGPLEQRAEHVRAGVVAPRLPGLVHQGQAAEAPHPLVGAVGGGRPRRSERGQLQLGLGPLDRVRPGRRHHHAEPQAVGQQVFDEDGADGGHRVVEVGVHAPQHAAVGQLG